MVKQQLAAQLEELARQVTPDRLYVGKDAFEAAYKYTIATLKSYGH